MRAEWAISLSLLMSAPQLRSRASGVCPAASSKYALIVVREPPRLRGLTRSGRERLRRGPSGDRLDLAAVLMASIGQARNAVHIPD